jgi:hypothetical protein
LEVRKRPVDVPLHHSCSGKALRMAGLLEGPNRAREQEQFRYHPAQARLFN